MKAFDVALKDMRQSFRSKGAIIFMFVIPILTTVLFSFMFGNIAGDDDGFTLPQTAVVLVNLDEGQLPENSPSTTRLSPPKSSSPSTGSGDGEPAESSTSLPSIGTPSTSSGVAELVEASPGAGSMGAFLADMLQGEELADLVRVTEMNDAAAARTAVDNQEAGIAVIIPTGFTDALTGEGEAAEVELYRDPTLTIGPAIVSSIVSQVVDGMASSTIGIGLTMNHLAEAGVDITPETIQGIVELYTTVPPPQQSGDPTVMQAPPGQDSGNELAQMLAFILGGMMVFYAFFTGANMLNTILSEQENGTLQRLFTTPTSHLAIFSGKFIATLFILAVQVAVLLLFGRLAFGIQWGEPLPVAIAAAGLVLIAATTGLFLVSFIKDPRQGGIIFGGLLTLTGMLGLITVFTASAPNTPQALETVSLFVPQGWAMRTFRQAMGGEPLPNIAGTFAVVLLWSVIFFFMGQYRLRKRFA